MEKEIKIEKKDLLSTEKGFTRKVLEEAHKEAKSRMIINPVPEMTQVDSTAVIWLVNPFIGISFRQLGDSVSVGLRCFLNDICKTTIGPNNVKEVLTLDIFIVKAEIDFSYKIEERSLVWAGTACYRKIPTLEWRCVTTGDQVLLDAGRMMTY